jgi:hypothetical protein
MVCRISCGLSTAFVIGMIYMTNSIEKSEIVKKYEKQLPENLKMIYKQVVKERSEIYYTGYFLGFLLAIVILILNVYLLKRKYSTATMVCQSVLISFIVNYFYYILTPKKNMMLEHIATPEQTKAWLKMYKGMQYSYHAGMGIGLIAVGIMAYGFRCV